MSFYILFFLDGFPNKLALVGWPLSTEAFVLFFKKKFLHSAPQYNHLNFWLNYKNIWRVFLKKKSLYKNQNFHLKVIFSLKVGLTYFFAQDYLFLDNENVIIFPQSSWSGSKVWKIPPFFLKPTPNDRESQLTA